VREAVSDEEELLIEVHGRLSPEDAIQAPRDLEEFRPYWFEEPICPECSVDELARVRNAIKIPVASGERIITKWQWKEVFEKQAVAIAQPDIIHCGGILEMKKIAAMAHASYTALAPHLEQGPCMIAANVHVDASTPNFLIQEFFIQDIPLFEAILKDPSFPMPKDGFIELPTKPGLGIDIDEKALTKKPFTYKPGCGLGGLWGKDPRSLIIK
jgi:galactonate dehydratase